MYMFKRGMTLLLALVLLLGLCLPGLSSEVQAAANGLVKKDGIWYYMKDGEVCNVTTLVKYNGEWWYVVNGKVASDMTTLVKYNGEWWYVVKGKIASKTTGLVKYNNEWWYIVKGKVASKTTTLVKYNNEWWYVINGKVASKTTTLVKYNNEWWYVVKGKIASKTTTLVKFNGSWYYIVKGKLAANTTTLVKYNGGWYYVNCGKVDNQSTAMVRYNSYWYYVNKGKVDLQPKRVEEVFHTLYHYDLDTGMLNYVDAPYGTDLYHYDELGQVFQVDHWEDSVLWGTDYYTHYDDGTYTVESVDDEYGEFGRYAIYNIDDNPIYIETIAAGYLTVDRYKYNEYGDVSVCETVVYSDDLEYFISSDYYTYSYEYNGQGKPVKRIWYLGDAALSITYYTYNTKGWLTQEMTFYDEEVEAIMYTHMENGDILSETICNVY